MIRIALLVVLALTGPVAAQQSTRDEIARLEIAHLKELVLMIDQKHAQLRDADREKNAQRFDAQEKAVAAALAAAALAVNKAEMASEKRLDSVNEFRGQLKDQAGTFITRMELWAFVVAMIGIGFGALQAYRNRKP